MNLARHAPPPRAALALAGFLLALSATFVHAGPGHDGDHDHDEAPLAGPADAPKRQPDGSVFLPKRSQRQLAVRTQLAEVTALPRTYQWVGEVVMDPNAGGKVQSTITGRVEPGPNGLPSLGQAVRKGEVLAQIRPTGETHERANQAAEAAGLRASLDVAAKRAARLQELEGSVPQKEIEAARAEVTSLRERLAAVGGSLTHHERLVAPVSGVIASSRVVSGEVVEAREVLFEIVDPARLHVEAVAHDGALAGTIAQASASVDGGKTAFPLAFVGAGRALREQAVPVRFRTTGEGTPPLHLGQRLQVVVQSGETIEGVAVPAAALVKNPSNQDIVWVHVSAERFAPRTVRHRMLDGATVAVTEGLAPGERVVVQGAALINQVR